MAARVADHLLPLAGDFSVWRWAALRATGFPADWVRELAAPRLAAAADDLLAGEEACARLRDAAVEICQSATRDLEVGAAREIGKLVKQLRRGLIPETLPQLDAAAAEAVAHFAAKRTELQQCRHQLESEMEAARLHTRDRLCAVARDRRFREAVTWQSRGALHGSIDGLLRQSPEKKDDKTRQQELLVASYVQRYCTRNETIGFFGPVGWARLSPDEQPLASRPGASLLAQRTVYFENWAVAALAEALSERADLRVWLAPRRAPSIRLDGASLVHSGDRRSELPAEFARALAECDGLRSAHQIAAQLLADSKLALASEEEVYAILEELATKKLIHWSLGVPTQTAYPEKDLRRSLERAGDAPAVRQALVQLEELEAARCQVATAAGDVQQLEQAIGNFEAVFERLTGKASTRREGQAYAGRTPIYEDCRRDHEVVVGAPILRELGKPLGLILQSARWFTHRVAENYRAAFTDIYRQLGGPVPLQRFADAASGLFTTDPRRAPELVRLAGEEVRSRWTELLALPADARRVQRNSSELLPKVEHVFAAPNAGMALARYTSPDVLLAADNAEAFARGDYHLVLGEVHPGFNTLLNNVFVFQHPQPELLERWTVMDRPLPMVEIVKPQESFSRATTYSFHEGDIDVEVGRAISRRPRERVLQLAELMVEEVDGCLRVRTLDGATWFEIVAFFGSSIAPALGGELPLFPAMAHRPRISIDKLVIARESWTLEKPALDFATSSTPLERFVATRRRLRVELGVPRFVFAKSPAEPKPVYVDLDSPIFVESLARIARKAESLTLSEMLPSIDEWWLADSEGRRYSSELRIVCVDGSEAEPRKER